MTYLAQEWVILAVVVLATAYTHAYLFCHLRDRSKAIRRFFVLAGLAAAVLLVVIAQPDKPLDWLLGLVLGFGLVHIPAGFLLYWKQPHRASRLAA